MATDKPRYFWPALVWPTTMDLEAIPGVGQKTAAALAELDAPAETLRSGDVATIARVGGMAPGRAARIARAAIQADHGESGEFLATDRAREIFQVLLEALQDRAVTEYGEQRLRTFYPSRADSRIEEVRELAAAAIGKEIDPSIRGALGSVTPLASPSKVQVRDRCLATMDAETYSAAAAAVPEMSVELVEDARDLAELARGYSTVIALDEEFAGVDIAGDVRVEPEALDRPAAIVPERELAFYAENYESLIAAVEVAQIAEIGEEPFRTGLKTALADLNPDGTIDGDLELDRLEAAVDELDAAVTSATRKANDQLREAIREQDVTIEGSDLLSLVEQGASVDSLLTRELHAEYNDAIETARCDLVDTLSLTDDEMAFVDRMFPDDPRFPVEPDETVQERLKDELAKARDRRGMQAKRELAAELVEYREPARAMVARALELDVERAIARFADDFGCTMPTFGDTGFAIEAGRNILLDEAFDAVEPVEYRVDDIAMLSGVNSGGKTAILDLVASVVILAHMGLPVPAESARVARVDSLYYFAQTQGTLDAGAFESTLRKFGELAVTDDAKLVLVDELESITEPGASAKIIAGILESLHASGASAVFVSHLAREIQEETRFDLVIDGIEAIGLEEGELVVDRSPVKHHIARSTPELIVEKLADEDTAGGFYGSLLRKFHSEE